MQVRSLVAALAEKVASSSANLDAQAISNALFGAVDIFIFSHRNTNVFKRTIAAVALCRLAAHEEQHCRGARPSAGPE